MKPLGYSGMHAMPMSMAPMQAMHGMHQSMPSVPTFPYGNYPPITPGSSRYPKSMMGPGGPGGMMMVMGPGGMMMPIPPGQLAKMQVCFFISLLVSHIIL